MAALIVVKLSLRFNEGISSCALNIMWVPQLPCEHQLYLPVPTTEAFKLNVRRCHDENDLSRWKRMTEQVETAEKRQRKGRQNPRKSSESALSKHIRYRKDPREIPMGFVSVSFIRDSKIPKTGVFSVRQVSLPASPSTLICWHTVLAAADLMTLFLLCSHLIRTIP